MKGTSCKNQLNQDVVQKITIEAEDVVYFYRIEQFIQTKNEASERKEKKN